MRPLLLVALLAAGACGGPDGTERISVSVYAAASLTEAFSELERVFEQAHPEADVAVTFAGSQVLRIQIEEGAPADVYASADPTHMGSLVDAGLVSQSRAFAGNELVVVVPLDDRNGIASFEDLPKARRIVLGTAQAPVGRYARQMLASADSLVRPGFAAAVLANVASEESNVRLARSKVELGEADAAVVYRTDVASSRSVRTIEIPDQVNVRADYLIGLVERRGRPALAEAWVDLVLSSEGRAVLARYGFVTE